jgi:DNA-binding transcriptional LysR family regulator
MDLRQLRYFTYVIDEGGVQRASELACVTQPAITAAVRSLEEEFGAKLFRKQGRKLVATATGLLLYDKAKLLLKHADDLRDDLISSVSSDVTTLRVGAPALVGNFLLADAISRFVDARPDIRVQLTQLSGPDVESRVLAGQLDIGFSTGTPRSTRVRATAVARRQIKAFVPRGHALADRDSLSWAEIFRHPLVTLPTGYVLHDHIARVASQLRLHADFQVQSDVPALIARALGNPARIGLLIEGSTLSGDVREVAIVSPAALRSTAELTISVLESTSASACDVRAAFTTAIGAAL